VISRSIILCLNRVRRRLRSTNDSPSSQEADNPRKIPIRHFSRRSTQRQGTGFTVAGLRKHRL
ncbi:hypothetical protein KEM54_004965, partial [Ascosphaera aggregata]